MIARDVEVGSKKSAEADGLLLSTLTRFERRLIRAFRHQPGGREALRKAVRELVVEMRAVDESQESVRRLIRYVAEHEAEAFRFERSRLLAGPDTVERLMDTMFEWIARPIPKKIYNRATVARLRQ